MIQPNPTRPAAAPVAEPTRPSLGAGFERRARVLQGLLAINALYFTGLVVVDLYFVGMAHRMIATPRRIPMADLERLDRVTFLSVLPLLGLTVLTASLFIAWLFQAHRSDRMDPDLLEHKSFWAIVGWFIPLLNLARPFQMVDDTRLGAQGSNTSGHPGVQALWWGAFVIAGFMDRVVASLWPDDVRGLRDYGDQLLDAARVECVANTLYVVAALCGGMVVRDVTSAVVRSPRGQRSA